MSPKSKRQSILFPPISVGLTVGPIGRRNGGLMYAEIEPAPPGNWRPWRGRTSRWWFEVHSTDPDDTDITTWAYADGGSGGGFTFRSCVNRAMLAIDTLSEGEYKDRLDT